VTTSPSRGTLFKGGKKSLLLSLLSFTWMEPLIVLSLSAKLLVLRTSIMVTRSFLNSFPFYSSAPTNSTAGSALWAL
jgi:hypothetical protein